MAKPKKLPSGRWNIRVYDYTDEKGNKRYKSITADTKRECERLASKFEIEKAHKNRTGEQMIFRIALERYIAERSEILSPASIRKYNNMARTLTDLDDYPLRELTEDVLQPFCNKLAAEYSPKTVKDRIMLIKGVINRFMPNATIRVKLPEKLPPKGSIPSEHDITRMMEAVKDTPMEIPIALGAICMLRRAEIAALTRFDIDKNNMLTINKSMVMNDNGEWVIKPPKTYSSNRTIWVPDAIADKIRHLPPGGIGLNPQAITNRFSRLLERERIPHCRFHDLRHFGATIRHSMGIPSATIQKEGGWLDIRTLEQIYTHSMSIDEKKSAQIMNEKYKKLSC